MEVDEERVNIGQEASVSRLGEDQLFYLMSRGLNYQQSRKLLINGFLLDVVEKITDLEIKDLIKNIMEIKE